MSLRVSFCQGECMFSRSSSATYSIVGLDTFTAEGEKLIVYVTNSNLYYFLIQIWPVMSLVLSCMFVAIHFQV